MHSMTLSCRNCNLVQSYGVGAMRRAGAEASPGRPRIVPPPGTLKTSGRARSSQVSTMIASPGCRHRSPSGLSSSKTSQASGAPSPAWRGAESRFGKVDSTVPIGFASKLAKSVGGETTLLGMQQLEVTDFRVKRPLLGDPSPAAALFANRPECKVVLPWRVNLAARYRSGNFRLL